MEEKENQFSKNLVALRKARGLTQYQLAEQLNYSDKTISKWENGDALPDTPTLYQLSRFFEVSMDSLYNGNPIQDQASVGKEKSRAKWNKLTIALLAVLVVWAVVVFAYVQVKIWLKVDLWILFIWALPASCIVLLVFNSIWGRRRLNYLIISVLIWTLILALHLQILPINENVWPIYFLGIPLQIATILWSQLKTEKKR
ncbi:MAG: helix-turn-helix transcriptional regulator [Clostridia bacterium]|nr:helix-turn-helix transcriptional regulator [Clostridia bacterium]MBQ8792426.1 helix-turn-helix transcriptional regulator [Clostridia bacterium]